MKDFLANAHWLHAVGLGVGYYYVIDKKFEVAGGITAAALIYMSMYGHGLPFSNEKKTVTVNDMVQQKDDKNRHKTLGNMFNNFFV